MDEWIKKSNEKTKLTPESTMQPWVRLLLWLLRLSGNEMWATTPLCMPPQALETNRLGWVAHATAFHRRDTVMLVNMCVYEKNKTKSKSQNKPGNTGVPPLHVAWGGNVRREVKESFLKTHVHVGPLVCVLKSTATATCTFGLGRHG